MVRGLGRWLVWLGWRRAASVSGSKELGATGAAVPSASAACSGDAVSGQPDAAADGPDGASTIDAVNPAPVMEPAASVAPMSSLGVSDHGDTSLDPSCASGTPARNEPPLAPATADADEAALIAAALLLRDLVTPDLPAREIESIAGLMESAMVSIYATATAPAVPQPEVDELAPVITRPATRRVTATPKANRPIPATGRPKRQAIGEKAKDKSKPRRQEAGRAVKKAAVRPPQRVVWLAPRTPAPAMVAAARPTDVCDLLLSAAEAVRAQFGTHEASNGRGAEAA